MATTLAPAINITNVSKGMNSLNTGLGNLKKSSDSIKTVTLNRTRIKRESFARDKVLSNMREEAIRRKDQESIIEASGIGGAMKRTTSVIGDSTKGFLSRILDFASNLLLGWLLYNLPTIMTAIQDLITRIASLTQLLRDFISNITNTFENFGNLLSGVYQNVTEFDFTDQSKRVQSAMDDLNVNLETMRDQFLQGFDMLSKPLGEGPGEEPVPEVNTDYTQDGPTTGGGVTGIHKQALDIISGPESGGSYNAMNQGTVGPDDRIVGSTGNSKTKVGKELTSMTLGEIMQRQAYVMDKRNPQISNYGVYAAGRYQIIPITFPSAMKGAGLKPTDTFSPENQDKMGLAVLKSQGIGAWTVGGSRYSAKETAIIKQAQRTPVTSSSSISQSTSPKPQSGKGGKVVEYLTGDRTHKRYRADHGAGNYHDHVAFDSQATRDAAMKWMRSRGWTIGSIDTGKHADGSFHYSKQAFDIPFYDGGNYRKKGATDDAKGETKFSSMVRADLIAGGFGGPQLGGSSTAPVPSAQVSSTTSPGQNVPSVAQNKKGPTVLIADNPQQPQPQQVSAGGGGSQPQMIPTESSLNSLIKNQILLELAYT
jgi:hypothetical protein